MAVIRLRWKDWSISEHGQRIYRSLDPIDTSNLPPVYATLNPEIEYFQDDNVIIGAKYHYVVSAFKDNIEKFSDPIIVDTGLNPLGPGGTELIGNNETAGFLGEVPNEEMIRSDTLATMVDVLQGSMSNATTPWLKFVLDRKVLFIPKTPIRKSISWDYLHAKNLVFGDRVVYVQGYAFKIRLMKGRNPNTDIPYTVGNDPEGTWGSEWNRLLYNLSPFNESYPKNSQVGENWSTYTTSALGISNGEYDWCQENARNASERVVRSGDSRHLTAAHYSSPSSSSGSYRWRPVLELITT